MKVLAIFGAGGQGGETLELARTINNIDEKWEEIIFINNGESAPDNQGCKVMGLEDAVSKYGDKFEGIIAIGEPALRIKIVGDFEKYNIPAVTLISPDVHVPASTTIGEGCCIYSGVYLSSNTTIGNHVSISPNAVIGHDVIIKDNVSIGLLAGICGMVTLEEGVYIGPGVMIKESITMGPNSVAAIGSVVFRDVSEGEMVLGNPARPTRRSSDHVFN